MSLVTERVSSKRAGHLGHCADISCAQMRNSDLLLAAHNIQLPQSLVGLSPAVVNDAIGFNHPSVNAKKRQFLKTPKNRITPLLQASYRKVSKNQVSKLFLRIWLNLTVENPLIGRIFFLDQSVKTLYYYQQFTVDEQDCGPSRITRITVKGRLSGAKFVRLCSGSG